MSVSKSKKIKMTKQQAIDIVKSHYGILTRTANKLGFTPSFVRQVIVLQERSNQRVWVEFYNTLKEMKAEKDSSTTNTQKIKEKIFQEALS